LVDPRAQIAAAAGKLRCAGDLTSALALYERLYREDPNDVQALAVLSDALVEARQAGVALELLEKAATASGPELDTTRAKALLALDRWPEALDLFNAIVEQNPNWADGWNNLACCLSELGREAEAAARWRRALELHPHHVSATLGLAQQTKKQDQLDQSRTLLENLLSAGDHPPARRALVDVLLRLGDTQAAVQHAKQLVQGPSSSMEDQMQLARAHFLGGDLDAYIACLDVVSDQPWKGVTASSVAIAALAESGRIDEARQRLAQHLAQDPADANARLVEARDCLRQGDFVNGWRAYAYRLRLPKNQIHFNLEPNWDGRPLQGRSVLVLGEQGLGDVCHFSRFLKPLLADNPASSLIAEPRMLPLLQEAYPKLHFSDPEQIGLLPTPLVRIALGSLPLLYGTSLEQVAALDQGIRANEADLRCLRARLDQDARHPWRVGISLLGGRPSDEYQRRKRSLPIATVLQQLAGLPITLVDLQHKGHPPEFHQEAERLALQVLHYPDLTDNLGLLVAAIAAVDGVLTAQQSNAHLCGALGQRGLVLLPPGCHFVFGEPVQTAWYPSLEVIRADRYGCWDGIEQEIPQRIQAWLA